LPPAGLVDAVTSPDGGRGFKLIAPLYVASPEVLVHYGIDPSTIDPTADVLTSQTDLAGALLEHGRGEQVPDPKIQMVNLPHDSSEPTALITTGAMNRLGLHAIPTAWLVRSSTPLTAAQIDAARNSAAAAGLTTETQESHQSMAQLGTDATVAGMVFALVVLAMTVGLIRSETAGDVRILTATGATSGTRRNLTAITTATLALLAAVLGVAAAYLALAAFYHEDLSTLTQPPWADLIALGLGLPLVATVAGWLLAGREPDGAAPRLT
jgi:putative ABC transport system permease protein